MHDGVVINYGYNLDGKATDKYGNPQYQTVRVPASRFTDDTYTIPAAQMRGNVLINGRCLKMAPRYLMTTYMRSIFPKISPSHALTAH